MAERYWHFCQVDEHGVARLGYDDNREVRLGETLRIEGEPVLCEHGLHASKRLWDALRYARSDRLCLCRVTLGGTVKHDEDKAVANERTVIVMLDADTTDRLLRDFARWCALQVAHLWDMPEVVRQYLETGDESLRDAARDAAWAATAAWNAAWAEAAAAVRAAIRAAIGAADAGIEKYADELERRGLAAIETVTV